MERLTVPDKKIEGGTRRAIIDAREVRKEAMTIYWALKKYEDLDLTPEQIREIDKLYGEKCRELADLKEDISQLNDDCAGLSQENKLFKAEIENLNELIKAEENGLLLWLPCKVGDAVYVIAECYNIPRQLDGTLYDSDGGHGTATGYYCPYEDSCPHDSEDFTSCDDCTNKSAVFEDSVKSIWIDEDGIHIAAENTTVCGDIGDIIFFTREEAEAKLAEMEGGHE